MNKIAHSVESPIQRVIQQAKVSGGGILAAAVAVPATIDAWTPTWFSIGWMALYLIQSVVFLVVVAVTGNLRVWQLWAISTAMLFSAICVSVVVWGSDHPSAPWIAAMICFAFIAFEVAVLPELKIPIWYTGITMAGIAISVMAAMVVNYFLAVAVVPFVGSMIVVAARTRAMREELDERLNDSETRLFHDPLTGLLSRHGLAEQLREIEGGEVTVAIFDADRFKQINDTQGHGVGDKVLATIAAHLRSTLPSEWRIARHGGDEFVAVTPGRVALDPATVAPLQMSLSDRTGQVNFTISAGVAVGHLSGPGDRLLNEAGHALRHAKRNGVRLVLSEGELRERFERSISLTTVDENNNSVIPVVPVAQAIVTDDGIVGCEMLARWRMPDGTLLAPGQFMDMLTENGLLGQLDDAMLEHAVSLAARLERSGFDLFVSANVAASHLLDVGLPIRVRQLLQQHNLSPERLMIEITESERLGKDRLWEGAVRGLRDLGIKLAIDDFGAGYSSVARLSTLPITHLKLDMALVQRANGPLGEIVGGVTKFCAESNIGVIAEGIETAEHHESMKSLGVDTYQGYRFGRPVQIEELIRVIADQQRAEQPRHEQSGAATPDIMVSRSLQHRRGRSFACSDRTGASSPAP